MPPKVAVDLKKGQTNLFSFFKKPAVSSNSPQTPATVSQPQDETTSPIASYIITEVVSEIKEDSSNKSQEANVVKNNSAKKPLASNLNANKRQKKIVVDDEDEWDESNDMAVVNTSDDNASSASVSGDESDDLLDDDDQESEDSSGEKQNKRKRLQKTKAKPSLSGSLPPRPKSAVKTPSTPLSGALSKPSSSNKNLVTPDTSKGFSPYFGGSSAANSINSKASSRGGDSPSTPSNQVTAAMPDGVLSQGHHEHNFIDLLKPQNRKDKAGRSCSHPDFDPRTLKLTDGFLKEQTPAMAQWWQLKSCNMDTVLFFKVGKFYELFHMDADIGFSELDLIYMKGTKAHSGFPEIAYGKFCNILVSKGYRVARVEQTETPEMMKERNESAQKGKKDKVVSRELCSVMSRGTRTYCHLDDLSLLDSEDAERFSSSVLLSIKEAHVETEGAGDEESLDPEDHTTVEYGVCVVDSVIGTVTLAQFQDDKQRSRLRTLVARYAPSEVLLESGKFSAKTLGVIKLLAPKAVLEQLRGAEMPDGAKSLQRLEEGQYFTQGTHGDDQVYPPVLQAVITGLPSGSSELVMSAVGGAVWQLRRSLIDYEVLSLGKVYAYIPPDESNHLSAAASGTSSRINTSSSTDGMHVVSQQSLFSPQHSEHHDVTFGDDEDNSSSAMDVSDNGLSTADHLPKTMTLDDVALTNLEVLINNYDRTEKGSLWAFLNRCKTAFGRRLLRGWLCHPLFRVRDIQKRSSAVEELLSSFRDEAATVRNILKDVPDLERLLARVHSIGIHRQDIDHPDSRAVLYENATYNARKIRDFADILTGFESVLKVGKLFERLSVKSSLLRITLKARDAAANPLGRFPLNDMDRLLRHFREIFDEKQAKKDGNIRPRPGIDPEYDQAKADVASCESDLEQYLREMKRETGISDLKYFGTNKDRFQIEVPIAQSSKVPRDWATKSQKKTHRRYWTAFIEKKLAQLVGAEERAASAQGDTLRRIFEKFDQSRAVWSDAVSCVALLDALLSLASISSLPNYIWPTVLQADERTGGPVLDIQGGRHPMLEFALSQRGEGDYIPNDLTLGGLRGSEFVPKMLLLSGPNMGGKSTLLRQTCLITILAQLGCKVPADSCTLTPVDRIFTRVGASDRILAGQSTFFVELAETATILNGASQDSLCILDELGRGTATFDGTAIAHAVVDYLVRRTRCRSLFATHYHSLVDDWEIDPRVRLGHMDCLVDAPVAPHPESMDDATPTTSGAATEEVTFLYKLCDGSSPRSYGINVARLAGLPVAVIDLAIRQSREFEERMKAKVTQQAAAALSGEDLSHTQLAAGISDILSRDKLTSVYEKLVSIAHSSVPIEELAYLAKEMWRRFSAVSA